MGTQHVDKVVSWHATFIDQQFHHLLFRLTQFLHLFAQCIAQFFSCFDSETHSLQLGRNRLLRLCVSQ